MHWPLGVAILPLKGKNTDHHLEKRGLHLSEKNKIRGFDGNYNQLLYSVKALS